MVSYATRIVSSQQEGIFLVTGGRDVSAQPAWFYVQVAKLKQPLFLKAITAGQLTLNEYGTILASGYGALPPAHVARRMKEQFCFETAA